MLHINVDCVVIGAGAAGLSCALKASQMGNVAVLTKDNLPAGNTPLAQGGIAAALDKQDSPELHIQDTLRAGAGICDSRAVKVLVNEGIDRVQQVLGWGFPCDRGPGGELLFSKEGAHSLARVISAGGDSSGRALAETLIEQARKNSSITVYQQFLVIDLLVDKNRCVGLLALDLDSDRPVIFSSRGVVLAAGGCGQIYAHTTNNINCSGDGYALAYRAGAVLENMEFVQFHPTALNENANPMFLVSEAVRGKGAILVNDKGERFMLRRHSWAELAPRDVVARGIFAELTQGNQVFLDVSPLGDLFEEHFPTICNACMERGINPPQDLIPVVPAAHFMMGGIKTDLDGRTSVRGLYACGEVASTGVHGANRLASNSLLEGLVYGHRVGQALAFDELPGDNHVNISGVAEVRLDSCKQKGNLSSVSGVKKVRLLQELRDLMWSNVGLVRTGTGLTKAMDRLIEMERDLEPEDLALKNMITAARLITESALARRESLGSHYRADVPENWEAAGALQDVSSL